MCGGEAEDGEEGNEGVPAGQRGCNCGLAGLPSQCELPPNPLLKEEEHNSQLIPAGGAPRGI